MLRSLKLQRAPTICPKKKEINFSPLRTIFTLHIKYQIGELIFNEIKGTSLNILINIQKIRSKTKKKKNNMRDIKPDINVHMKLQPPKKRDTGSRTFKMTLLNWL